MARQEATDQNHVVIVRCANVPTMTALAVAMRYRDADSRLDAFSRTDAATHGVVKPARADANTTICDVFAATSGLDDDAFVSGVRRICERYPTATVLVDSDISRMLSPHARVQLSHLPVAPLDASRLDRLGRVPRRQDLEAHANDPRDAGDLAGHTLTFSPRYADDGFDLTRFRSVTNWRETTPVGKPKSGGIWLSLDGGWERWCEREQMDEWASNGSYQVTLKPDTHILMIASADDMEGLPQAGATKMTYAPVGEPIKNFDYERLALSWDGICVMAGSNSDLYHSFYGWDCNSLVLLNPDCVESARQLVPAPEQKVNQAQQEGPAPDVAPEDAPAQEEEPPARTPIPEPVPVVTIPEEPEWELY